MTRKVLITGASSGIGNAQCVTAINQEVIRRPFLIDP
ncbi:MAG: hypothetical protein QOF85_1068 [Solirubrobacterales bacterium]|jgi:NADP-dependent 3-hydroxy acid dehydrogenase YdfG|nr:hypothetical protein [Solirubrobacterales bacterium]